MRSKIWMSKAGVLVASTVLVVMHCKLTPPSWNKTKDHLTCKPARRIVYLKTHKTGSTTLKEILERHARRYKLSGKVLDFPFPLYCGYPGRLRKDFCVIDTYNMTLNREKQASILIGHFRFDEETVRDFMNPQARYITIMRNPFKVSESSFTYYYVQKCDGHQPFYKRALTCPGFPYVHVLGKVGMNYSDFLTVVSASTVLESPWGFRAKNYQSHDFGLDPYNESFQYVLREAKKLDKRFDLVLILEHFFESLVLLKDLLCMKWSDIVPISRTVGTYVSRELTPQERHKVYQLTTQDRILYDYFNKSLWNKIERYGKERMKTQVERLKRLGWLKGRQTTVSNDKILFGNRTAISSVTFQGSVEEDHIADLSRRLEKAYPRGQISTVNDRQIFYELADYMVRHNGWCPRVRKKSHFRNSNLS